MKALLCPLLILLSGCIVTSPGTSPRPVTDGPPTAEQYASYFSFEAIDSNRDGRIALSEFLDANHTVILNNPQRDTQDFQAHDRDRDGFMNRQEHAVWYAALLSTWRSN